MGKIVDGVYYNSDGNPAHRGIIELDGKLYYAGKNGNIIKDETKVVHSVMTNGLIKHGTYYFDPTGAIDLSTYKKPKKRKSKKFKVLGSVFIAVLVIIAVFALFSLLGRFIKTNFQSSEGSEITISVPEFKEEVYLCSPQMKQYYEGDCSFADVLKLGHNPYRPLVFKYELSGAESAVLLLGEENDFSDAVEYALNVRKKELSINNLKTGTEYYYKITATDKAGKSKEVTGSFKTADTNRFIYLPGLYNTRDIGGYKTVDNKRVRQGMLIRGTEADGLVENTYYLSDPKDAERFGFVCDFDLRNSDIFNTGYKSRFGSNVVHKFYNSPQYGGIFAKGQEETLRQIFSDLADRRNYPMYLHCTYGADRTGTVVFLLQGLLGVSEEDMLNEYKMTGFWASGFADGAKINPVISGLEGVDGKTINEKIHNYMVGTVGITEQQVAQIRAVFLE